MGFILLFLKSQARRGEPPAWTGGFPLDRSIAGSAGFSPTGSPTALPGDAEGQEGRPGMTGAGAGSNMQVPRFPSRDVMVWLSPPLSNGTQWLPQPFVIGCLALTGHWQMWYLPLHSFGT